VCRGPDGPDPEVVELFDRYLGLFAEATRRFGHLFPYNHLRLRLQSLLAGRVARVTVRDADTSFDMVLRDGEFQRVVPEREPACWWTIDASTLQDAAERPWIYLAHPRRLGLAWFDVGDGALERTCRPPS
jgi:hypothetical protein